MARICYPALGSLALLAACVLLGLPHSAMGYWGTAGNGSGSASLTTLTAPAITGAAAGAESVELSWSSVSAPGEGTVEYYVTRDGGPPSAACPSASAHSTVTSCIDTNVPIGTHKYVVTAVWRSWSAASEQHGATVSFGQATNLVLEAASATPTAGEADNMTITVKDMAGNTVRTYAGTHSLTFEGAGESASGSKPTVVDRSGTSKHFGEATELTFTEGKATVASGKNGALKLYKAEETHIIVTEGSLSNGTGLAVTVKVAATKKLAIAAPSETTAGATFNATLTATDEYGNMNTSYTGAKTITWSGPASSPNGKAPEYPTTATTVTFTNGVGTASGIDLYDAVASVTLTAKEGATIKGSTPLKVVASTAKTFAFTAISEQTAGTAFNATLTAKDEYGNTATSYTGAKTITWSGPASSPSGHAPEYPSTATTVTFTNGIGKATAIRLYDAVATTLTAKEGAFIEGTSSSFNVKAGAYKRIDWSEPHTEPAGKIVSAICIFECAAEGLGSEGKFIFKVATTDEWGNLQASHGSGSKTIKLSAVTCTGCSLSTSTLTIAEGVAASAEAMLTGAANTTWSGTLEASEPTLKATATATLKH